MTLDRLSSLLVSPTIGPGRLLEAGPFFQWRGDQLILDDLTVSDWVVVFGALLVALGLCASRLHVQVEPGSGASTLSAKPSTVLRNPIQPLSAGR